MTQYPWPEVATIAEIRDPLERFAAATQRIDGLQEQSQALQEIRSMAAAELHASGMSYREVGDVLGLSTQRVGQMVTSTKGPSLLVRAWGELERKLSEVGSYAEVATTQRSPARLIDALVESGDLATEQAEALHRLRVARNEAAHSKRPFEDPEIEHLLDEAISLSAELEQVLEKARDAKSAAFTEERQEAEALLRRVASQHPGIDWLEGRCDECGRPIPVPDTDLWVCSQACRESWFHKLYHYIDPGSEEETITHTPRVVPYWI